MANAMMVIYPYWHGDTWVFDDDAVGLLREPFVFGVPEMIDDLVKDFGPAGARSGFRLTFSGAPFPGFQRVLVRRREEYGGNWYSFEGEAREGWLCPALFRYFRDAPERLYVRSDARSTCEG